MQKISNRISWHNIKGDVEEFIKKRDQSQKHGKSKNVSIELDSNPIKTDVMQQIGINISSHPEVRGFKHFVVCIG